MNNNIEKKLASIKTKDLSASESANLWQNIWHNRGRQLGWTPFSLLLNNKNMTAILIALALVFGGSIATVQASNAAKPGDLLFPIDQAVEKVQLALSNNQKKDELKIKIATERTDELEQIIDETRSKGDDKKREDNIKTSLNLVAAIRDDLNTSVSTSTDEKIKGILERIEKELQNLDTPIKLQAKFRGDNGAKFEIEAEEEDDGRIKVHFESKGIKFLTSNTSSTSTSTASTTPRVKGEDKIKVCHVVSATNKHDLKISRTALAAHLAHGDTIGECDDDNDNSGGLSEAEAKIGLFNTVLKYEFNDHKFTLTLNSTSTDAIIKALIEKTKLSEVEIRRVLKIERSNTQINTGRANDDDRRNSTSSATSSNSGASDDDNDDDHGGRGRGNDD